MVLTAGDLVVVENALNHPGNRLWGLDSEAHGPTILGKKKGVPDPLRATATGLSLGFEDGTCFYAPLAHSVGANLPANLHGPLAQMLSSAPGMAVSHNRKFDQHLLERIGIRPKRWACSEILAWLVGAKGVGKKRGTSIGLKPLTLALFGHQMETFDEVSKGRSFDLVPPEEALSYVTEDAIYTLALYNRLIGGLDHYGIPMATFERELAFVDVLVEMEREGILLNTPYLEGLMGEMDASLARVNEEWNFLFPGVNPGSSQQLAEALVGGAGVWPAALVDRTKPSEKHPKGQLSFNKAVLERLADTDRVPSLGRRAAELKLEYNFLSKNRGTYTTSLIQAAGQYPDNHIRTTFHQTGTKTGRLSSSNPNLQNIPIRTEMGKRIRQALVAPEGHVFVRADYNQLQLRILASLVGRGPLFDAFWAGRDAHQETGDVASCSRAEAKTVNYLTLFGGGAGKLAATLGIPKSRAQDILDRVQAAIGSKDLTDKIAEVCQERGFIRTFDQRIQKIEVGDSPWDRGRREAPSGVIQGGEAGIMKMAMVATHHALHTTHAGLARSALQIHDEYILVAREKDAEEAKALLKSKMEGAFKLNVPLVADAAVTKTLGK